MPSYRLNVDGTITLVKDVRHMTESERRDHEAEREAELEYIEGARQAASEASRGDHWG